MKTPTTVNHHPLHPIFVEFPIALWIFAFAADIAYYAGAGDIWSSLAFYTMGAGIIGAVVAAVPGMIDLVWLKEPHLKRIGVTHAIINVVVLVLFVINWFWRYNGNPTGAGPLLLSFIGVAGMLFSGWLGAELVHRHRVTVEERFASGETPAKA